MDTYDNVTPMPGRQQQANGLPPFNLKALSLFTEDGHLTVTFWLLCAAIVVVIYLVIETISVDEAQDITPVAPNAGQNNHSTPTPAVVKSRKPTTEPVAKENGS
jgi:hypothetical protein